jgi:hypothetical protein
MATTKKRQRAPKEGDILSLSFGDGTYGFCQVSQGRDYAFFDIRTEIIPAIEKIVECPVLFRVPMYGNTALEEGWTVIGNMPLTGSLAENACYRNQPVGSNQQYLYKDGQLIPSAMSEVKDLEVLSWWFASHIVERLRDYFEGRTNPHVELMRKIKVYDPETGREIEKNE